MGFHILPLLKEVSYSKHHTHLLIQIGGGTLFASLALVPMWLLTPHDLPIELLLRAASSYEAAFFVGLGCELVVPRGTNLPSVVWGMA